MGGTGAAPAIAVEGKDGGISVKAQTQMRAMFCRTGQGGPLFVASMRALM